MNLKTTSYISLLLGIMLLLSFSIVKKDCHITFGVSSKLRIKEESKDGNTRVYADQKETFILSISRFKSKQPKIALADSIGTWYSTCQSIPTNEVMVYDTLDINQIEVVNYSFKCSASSTKWIHNIYGFYSDSHIYKMDISYPNLKKDKSQKEMSKILSSLEVSCR